MGGSSAKGLASDKGTSFFLELLFPVDVVKQPVALSRGKAILSVFLCGVLITFR